MVCATMYAYLHKNAAGCKHSMWCKRLCIKHSACHNCDACGHVVLCQHLPQSWDTFTEDYVGWRTDIVETDPKKLMTSQEFIGIIHKEYRSEKTGARGKGGSMQRMNRTGAWTSVWKSGHRTGKRPWPDRTVTEKDRKLSGPTKTVTTVRSMVLYRFQTFKTKQKPVLTG